MGFPGFLIVRQLHMVTPADRASARGVN